MGLKDSELSIVWAREARSLALYGLKASELSTVWAQRYQSLALYGFERLGGFSSIYIYTEIADSHIFSACMCVIYSEIGI